LEPEGSQSAPQKQQSPLQWLSSLHFVTAAASGSARTTATSLLQFVHKHAAQLVETVTPEAASVVTT
jgi:hypothetical protein